MKVLMGKPKNALIAASKETMKNLGLTAVKYTVCVHVVVPPHAQNRIITEDDPLPGVIDEHWQCIKSNLIHLGFVRDDTAIYFSSNKPSPWALNLAEKHMNKYGKVVINPSSWDGNLTSYGLCNSTVRASFAHEELTNNLIYDPYLINSYIFGECDVSISSGTTYGIFNAARTGYSKRAYLYKAAPLPIKKNGKWIVSDEKEYCGPMHRIDLPRVNIIQTTQHSK